MTIRHPLRFLALAVGLGWAYDLLFWGKSPGVSVLLYALLLLIGLLLSLRWQRVRAMPVNLWMPALLILFAALAFVRANAFLIFLNILAVLSLFMLIIDHLTRDAVWRLRVIDLFFDPIKAFVHTVQGGVEILVDSRHFFRDGLAGERGRHAPAVLVGLLISLPILLILIPLLMSADLIFAEMLHDIFSWGRILEWSIRIFFMAINGLLAGGALLYAAQERTSHHTLFRSPAADAPSTSTSILSRLGIIEALIPLTLVNLLFLAFVFIQISYLFGGERNIGEHAFSYAEYARRGFAELVIVAMFIFAIILILHRLSRPETPVERRAFNLSATLLLLLTMILLVSAFKRLTLYEMAYGYTTMRIYPHVFMIWLGLLLAWFAATLWLAPGRLAIGMLAAFFGFALTLNLLNPDAFIVRRNIARFYEQGRLDILHENGGQIDTRYFDRLSADAVPALLAELPEMPDNLRTIIEEGLQTRYAKMQDDKRLQHWQSWNVSRWRAYGSLEAHFEQDAAR